MTSASTIGRPYVVASSLDTVDLPEAMPPVRPTTDGRTKRTKRRAVSRRLPSLPPSLQPRAPSYLSSLDGWPSRS